MHPPAHMRAHLQQYDHSLSALARHSSASTSQHESPPHLGSAAHPSHIPLAPEGRAIADSQAYASDGTRLLVSIDHRNAKFLIPPWQAALATKKAEARAREKATDKGHVHAKYRSVEAEHPLLLSHFALHRLVDDFEATMSFQDPCVDHGLILEVSGFRVCRFDFHLRC